MFITTSANCVSGDLLYFSSVIREVAYNVRGSEI